MSTPIDDLKYFDFAALSIFAARSPDPFLARLMNMVDHRVRGSLTSAIPKDRFDRIRELIEKEKEQDPQKDQIVRQGVLQIKNKLLQENLIRREGEFYCG